MSRIRLEPLRLRFRTNTGRDRVYAYLEVHGVERAFWPDVLSGPPNLERKFMSAPIYVWTQTKSSVEQLWNLRSAWSRLRTGIPNSLFVEQLQRMAEEESTVKAGAAEARDPVS